MEIAPILGIVRRNQKSRGLARVLLSSWGAPVGQKTSIENLSNDNAL